MASAPQANRNDVEFNHEVANSLINIFKKVADTLDEQSGSRNTAVNGALVDFEGYFSTVFEHNSTLGSNDAGELVSSFRDASQQVQTIKESAKREQENRQKARDWEDRSIGERFDDWIHNEQAPQDTEPEPNFNVSTPAVNQKEVPALGTVGDNGGLSSAVPTNLTTATATMRGLDDELPTPQSVQDLLTSFGNECKWGTLDASSFIQGYRDWLSSNAEENVWLDSIAEAFEAAGSTSANPQSLSNEALSRVVSTTGHRTDLDINSPTVSGAMPSSGYVNDPVNVATGNFIEPEQDLEFDDPARALTFTRMYNSLGAEREGVFGAGWSSPLDSRLILTDESASWVQNDGRHVIFPRAGLAWDRASGYPLWLSSEEVPVLSYGASLPEKGAELLVIRDNMGAWWSFSSSGQWLAQGNGVDTVLTVSRNEDGLISRLDHRWGRYIEIEYSNGQVACVQASDGRRAEYFYDRGLLVEVKTVAGSRQYTYDEQDLLAVVEDAAGKVEVRNTYDSMRRVAEQVTEFGRTVRYSYLGNGLTVIADADGQNSNSWVSDNSGRLIALADADGNSQSMAYDSFGNRVSITERDKSITVHAYDKRGRIQRSRTPEGADLTYEWDEADRIVSVVTETGDLIEYEYEGERRNPSVVRDSLGGATSMKWQNNLLTSVIGPTGVSVQLAYNSMGELTAMTNAAGNTTEFIRDKVGRVVETILPSGAKTQFTYDAAGNLVARREADGAVSRFTYSSGNRLTSVTDPSGATTSFKYGAHGEIEKTTDPLGRVVSREFDAMGYIRSLKLPSGESWSFKYDTQGEVTETTNPLGFSWTYEHSVLGEVSATVDPTGVRSSRSLNRAHGTETVADAFTSFKAQYDAYGRLTKETAVDGSQEIYTHDAGGNIVEVLDAEGGLTRIERNLAGAVTAVISPEGLRSEYTYDDCGRPELLVEPSGERITLKYDEDSRIIARSSSFGTVETFTYDVCGRVIEHSSTTGSRTRIAYDKCSRVVFVADGKYGQRRFSYDEAGQMVCATSGIGGKTHYTYTVTGQIASMTDASGAVTRYRYDAADQLIERTDALGRKTAFTYDAAGRRKTVTDALGNEHGFSYDAAGLLATRTLNGTQRQSIHRDPASRTLKITAGANTHTLKYNCLGALVSHSGDGLERHWSYNGDGDRLSFSCDGVRDEYIYGPGGLLASVTRSSAPGASVTEQVCLSYDASGVLIGATDGQGRELLSVSFAATGAPATGQSGQQEMVADGGWARRVVRSNLAGEVVESTTYYDADGLLIGVDDADGLRLFSYDEAHQLTAVRSAAGVHSFEYSAGGFLTREVSAVGVVREYSYDGAGQLVRVVDSALGTSEFVYDGLGRRVRQVDAAGVSCEYAWDELDRLVGVTRAGGPVLGLSYDPLGQLSGVGGVSVVWDGGSIGIPSVVSVGGVMVPLRAVVGIDLVGDRGLDPFGLAATVFDPEVFDAGAFSGPGDLVPVVGASSGLLVDDLEVLGFRVYDPASRGFLSVDPLVSPVGAGWGANVYSFAGNAPSALVDPWGLSPVSRADFATYAEEHPSGISSIHRTVGHWVKENWAGIAVVAAGVVATALLGPLGAAVVGGALISGGFSMFTNKNPDGSINWGAVAKDALFGAISGGVGAKVMGLAGKALSSQFGKLSSAASTKAQAFAGKAAVHGGKADALGWWRPVSKGYHRVKESIAGARSARFDAKASTWNARADVAGDATKFADNLAGKSINGSASGATANGLAYTFSGNEDSPVWGVRDSWSVGGMAKAVGTGGGLGGVAPLAPASWSKGSQTLRGAKLPVANKLNSEGFNTAENYLAKRTVDYAVGAGNYWAISDGDQYDGKTAGWKGVNGIEKGVVKDLKGFIPTPSGR